ncbi:MAG: hypothetical protein A4E55_02140 [Pelotomaculum sp. PtaU1.Bin035]|nr:MAG: hypothetical protein A4E55_02140 [Pelotomaculum sp. PtaU1.Bin035]
MRLSELKVDGFGILSNLHLEREDLEKNITVIYGMNEAGKSTLMEFIRAVLFGFKINRCWREPLRGGRLGGRLAFMDVNGGLFRIERTLLGKRGKVTVTLPDGTAGDETFLKERILRNVTQLVFRNIFAFGIDELRCLEELGAGEVSAHVYGAGTGLRADRITAGLNHLQKELSELFLPGGVKPAINRLLKELEEAEAAIRRLQREPGQYVRLVREAVSLRERRERLEAAKRAAEFRKRRLEAAVRARESWVRLKVARLRLEGLLPVPSFPESGIDRLQALEDKTRDLGLAREETVRQAVELQKRIDKIEIDYGLLEYSSEIKALEGERVLQLERLRYLPEQVAEVKHFEEEYYKQERKLGDNFDRCFLESTDTSLPAREMAEGFKLKFIQAEIRLQDARGEVARSERNVEEKRKDLLNAESDQAEHKVPAPPVDCPLATRERALDVLDTGTRRITLLRAGLDQQRVRLVELEQQKEDFEGELEVQQLHFLPKWLPGALAVVLIILTAAAFLAGVVPGFLALSAGAAVMALVLRAGRHAAGSLEARHSRLAENLLNLKRRIEDITKEIELLTGQEESLAEELKGAASTALGKPEFSEEELPAARRALEEEKRAVARARDLERVVIESRNALDVELLRLYSENKALSESDKVLNDLRGEWLNWLKERRLPLSLKPSGTIAYFDAVEEAGRRYHAWQKSAVLERETRRQSEVFLVRLNDLLARVGYEAATMETACDRVVRLVEMLSEFTKLAGEKDRRKEELDRLRAQKLYQENALNTLQDEIKVLLAEGGAVEPEEFRRRAALYHERKQVAGEIETYERDLNIIAGSRDRRALLDEDLEQTEKSENERELSGLAVQIEETEREIKEAGEEIGGLDNRISLLENGEELAARLQEKEMLLAALKGKARDWQARALCLNLLNLAKERHERERQPAVLRQASEYIGPMTGLAYHRVIAPVGRADMLEVETPDGGRVAIAGLSRGAASQLYLSVRLALARQYGSVGLPVILDDILVDFDQNRLRGALQVLGEYGRDRQVILFTCHDHILKILGECLDNFGLVHLQNGMKISNRVL